MVFLWNASTHCILCILLYKMYVRTCVLCWPIAVCIRMFYVLVPLKIKFSPHSLHPPLSISAIMGFVLSCYFTSLSPLALSCAEETSIIWCQPFKIFIYEDGAMRLLFFRCYFCNISSVFPCLYSFFRYRLCFLLLFYLLFHLYCTFVIIRNSHYTNCVYSRQRALVDFFVCRRT